MRKRLSRAKLFVLPVLLAAFLLFGGCGVSGDLRAASRECGIDLSGCRVIEMKETHGGFLGDGETWIVAELPDGSVTRGMEQGGYWHPLPLPEPLRYFFDEFFFEEYRLEDAENGFWYFYDRHAETEDPSDPSELFDRASFNFTFARYDADAGIFTFIRVDT